MKNNRSVSFIISFWGRDPIGGLRIIYEYANRLALRGWKVTVVHAALRPGFEPGTSPAERIRFRLRYFKQLLTGSYLPKSWFRLNPKVKVLWTPTLDEKYIPDAGHVVACPVESAAMVNSYSPRKGKKFYFLQHFEEWVFPPEKVRETWKFPLKKIVIAKWLLEIAESLGEQAWYVPNGLDPAVFAMDVPLTKRKDKSILFLSHTLENKGTKYVVEAVARLRDRYPDLTACTFGVSERPADLPDFIQYFQNPPQEQLRSLYNSAKVFISPSLAEGWPLPPAEAMMCGCIVLATDIGGHREYVIDKETGLLCLPASADSIAEKLEWIFSNPEAAEKVAENGVNYIRRFDWDSRVDLFEKALLSE